MHGRIRFCNALSKFLVFGTNVTRRGFRAMATVYNFIIGDGKLSRAVHALNSGALQHRKSMRCVAFQLHFLPNKARQFVVNQAREKNAVFLPLGVETYKARSLAAKQRAGINNNAFREIFFHGKIQLY